MGAAEEEGLWPGALGDCVVLNVLSRMQSYDRASSQIDILQSDVLGVGLLEYLRAWGCWPNLTKSSRSLQGRGLQKPAPPNRKFQLLPPTWFSFSKWQNGVAPRGGRELISSTENGFPPTMESSVVGRRVVS